MLDAENLLKTHNNFYFLPIGAAYRYAEDAEPILSRLGSLGKLWTTGAFAPGETGNVAF